MREQKNLLSTIWVDLTLVPTSNLESGDKQILSLGLVRDLNPGPLAPKARIIPLDQRATEISILVIFNQGNAAPICH